MTSVSIAGAGLPVDWPLQRRTSTMNGRWWWGALIGLLAAGTPQARTLGTLEFQPCTLAPALMPVSVDAQCSTLKVPEDRANPQGRQVELALAWVPA